MKSKKTDQWTPKKAFYIFLTTVLGSILGCLAYGLTTWACSSRYPLPQLFFWMLITAGAVSGFLLGFRWWRIVYIERRHWKWNVKKKRKK